MAAGLWEERLNQALHGSRLAALWLAATSVYDRSRTAGLMADLRRWGGRAVAASTALRPLTAPPPGELWWWRGGRTARAGRGLAERWHRLAAITRHRLDDAASGSRSWAWWDGLSRPGAGTPAAERSLATGSRMVGTLKDLATALRQHRGLSLFAFLLPLAPTLALVGWLGVLAAVHLPRLRRADGSSSFPALPEGTPYILLTAWILLAGVLASVTPRESLPYGLAWLVAGLALYLAYDLARDDPGVVWGSLAGLFLGTVVVGLYAIYQFLIGVPMPEHWLDPAMGHLIQTRVFATFDNPVLLAQYLAMVLPLALFVTMEARRLGWRLLAVTVLAVGGLALVFTFSRGGWLSLAVAVMVYGALRRRVLWVLAGLVLAAAPFVVPEAVFARAASTFSLEDTSNRYRLAIWLAAGRLYLDHWLLGIGAGVPAFAAVYPHYLIPGAPAAHAHNFILQHAIETGLVGLLLLSWFFSAVVRQLLALATRPVRRAGASESGRSGGTLAAGLCAAILAAVAGQFAQGMVDHLWVSPKLLILTLLLVGFGLAQARSAHAAADEHGGAGA